MSNNPLLQNVKLPGRTFALPSRGALYQNNELTTDVVDGEIHIHPLSGITEINLKNPDLLFNGKAIEAVVAECVPQIKQPLELFGRDIDALLFFLRIATYGSEFRIEVKHDCENGKDHGYVVDLEQHLSTMKSLDPTLINTQRKITIQTGQTVFTRPIRFKDIIKLFHLTEKKKELLPEDIKQLTIINLLNIIEKVDDITDSKLIEEWLRVLPSPYLNKITSASEILNDWGPEQVVTLKCKDCGESFKVELPLNPINFFTE